MSDFYKASSDWTYDIYQSQSVWLKRIIVLLIVTIILLMISLIANLLLIPLKEKVPYLYAFDHATGEITKIGTLEATTLSSNWELTKYLLTSYIINYEKYDIDDLERPYQQVLAQSQDNVKRDYQSQVVSTNQHSPYHLYGKDKFISVKVISINRLNDNTVDVKFEKTLHDRLTGSIEVSQKEAILKWFYSKAETTQSMLEKDPLGFKVNYYQVSQMSL